MSVIKTVQQIKSDILQFSPAPDRVKLLAVSKKQSVEKIQMVLAQDHFLFGENYVQEALEKIEKLPSTIHWHLIGHLQSKKVNTVVGKFDYIHSVDSLKLARLLSEKSLALGITQKIFLEINLGNEDSKTGFIWDQLDTDWNDLQSLSGISICGFMALPPQTEDTRKTREHFKLLRIQLEKRQTQSDRSRHPLNELSMGTSQDYTVALQEGSTYIRIGTSLFGER